ncbi:MAG: hypothetical protein NZ561_03670, partial [Phycisphaerae bacterium]|nr:hypothetical protein [Phycisphaerae bacterium]MDW8262357.1 hypothetical protein [Phycisphaerales bacterium]
MSSASVPPSPPTTGPEADLPAPPTVRLSFWQLRWVQNVIPLLGSLAIHAGIVVFGYLFFRGAEA